MDTRLTRIAEVPAAGASESMRPVRVTRSSRYQARPAQCPLHVMSLSGTGQSNEVSPIAGRRPTRRWANESERNGQIRRYEHNRTCQLTDNPGGRGLAGETEIKDAAPTVTRSEKRRDRGRQTDHGRRSDIITAGVWGGERELRASGTERAAPPFERGDEHAQ